MVVDDDDVGGDDGEVVGEELLGDAVLGAAVLGSAVLAADTLTCARIFMAHAASSSHDTRPQ